MFNFCFDFFSPTKETNLLMIEKPLTYQAFFLSLEQFHSFCKLNFFLQRKRVTYINFLFINDDQLLLVNDVTIWSNKVFTIEWKLHTFRVANVVADHDDLLTHWRYMYMSKFRTNIFSIATTSNYFWSSVVAVVKVDYFVFSFKKVENLVWIRC